ncbi:MAG: 50S ribosomal protein L18 [uncultured bacterium]|nr:MAG: 50S ribosomal protein L18 [uncultured bacterium]
MAKKNRKWDLRYRRNSRVRAKIFGTKKKPRLSVYRSLKHIYAQIIDDESKKTLVAASDNDVKTKSKKKTELAFEVGKCVASKALKKKIEYVVFDRGSYQYHGKVKALAEGARKAGLKF